MVLKNASTMLSRLKTAFTKSPSQPLTSTPLKADGVSTSTSPTLTEAPSRASQDTTQAESRASKQADADTTEPLPDIAEQAQPATSSTNVPLPPLAFSSPPLPPIITTTTITTNLPNPARHPRDIMLQHASLLPKPAPQPILVDLITQLHPPQPQPNTTTTPIPLPMKFTSPLPIHPLAAPLSLAHFRCPTHHTSPSSFLPSSNAHAPTLCTTCHRSGDAVLAACTCCGIRICGRCVGLLGIGEGEGDGDGLERLLGELVREGWWMGLRGQG